MKLLTRHNRTDRARILPLLALLFAIPAAPAHADKIYWTDQNSMRLMRANLDGTEMEVVRDLSVDDPPRYPVGIALDLAARTIYFGRADFRGPGLDQGGIYRTSMDGGGPIEDIIPWGSITKPLGIALNLEDDKIFWADAATATIESADLSGANRDVVWGPLLFGLPNGLAIDESSSMLFFSQYWQDPVGNAIVRASDDGITSFTSVWLNEFGPGGVAIDQDYVYFTMGQLGVPAKIMRLARPIENSKPEVLIPDTAGLGLAYPIALDVDRGEMYVAEFDFPLIGGSGKLWRANLDGSGLEDITPNGFGNPGGIALDLMCIPGDLDCNGEVATADLLTLLGNWGPCPAPCPADLDGNGTVGTSDLLTLLGNWG